jgi:hypothetical protein
MDNKLICKICGKITKNYNALQVHARNFHRLSSKEYYDLYLKKDNEGHCNFCQKPSKYIGLKLGYQQYCCRKCADSDPKKAEKAKKTNSERYGEKREEITKRIKETKQKKYGNENYNNIEQAKQTNLLRYGTENVFASEHIKAKIRQTNLEKYGTGFYTQTEECKEKTKITCEERYGGIGFASEELLLKYKETMLEKYGVENPIDIPGHKEKLSKIQIENAEERMQKTRETNLEKYGTEFYTQTEECKEKTKRTNLKRYGVKHPWQNEIIKAKNKSTMLKRYGVEFATQSPKILQKIYKTISENGNQSSEEFYFEELCKKYKLDYIPQYKTKDNRYPFACDYYIPSRDLFIEINIHWTHGFHWFNKNSIEDLNKIENWKRKNTKYYNNAIIVWTQRDVEKRKYARKSKLNYIVFWNRSDIDNWFTNGCPNGKDWLKEYTWISFVIIDQRQDQDWEEI